MSDNEMKKASVYRYTYTVGEGEWTMDVDVTALDEEEAEEKLRAILDRAGRAHVYSLAERKRAGWRWVLP